MKPAGVRIRELTELRDQDIAGLSEVLIDCVEGNDSISFLYPLAPQRAWAFWQRVGQAIAARERVLLVADDASGVVGTVQLVLDQPENQPHRGDLAKMLVHRRARRRGIGAALLAAAEHVARRSGKTLLVLDTNEASDAARLYERNGWIPVGTIPEYSVLPRGGKRGTTYFYKQL